MTITAIKIQMVLLGILIIIIIMITVGLVSLYTGVAHMQ